MFGGNGTKAEAQFPMKRHHPVHGGMAAPSSLEDFFASVDGTPLANAFNGRKVVHPSIGISPVPEEERESIWREITATPRRGKSVAYLHVPFCANHCLFCGFYQSRWRDENGTPYTDAVIENLRREADLPYQSQGPVHAVYFGGGTPSALSARDLARLVQATRKNLPLAPDCEITIEGRVHSFTSDKMRAVFDAGANRVSIGVQSFHEELRRSMGRKASREKVIAFLEELVAVDKGAVIIDLIYGFPNQSMEMWEADVRTAIEIGLDGVDLYALNLIPGTPLLTAIEKGKFAPTAKTEYGAYYERGSELLEHACWETISTTHWRRTARERNIYNREAKKGADCLAFGSGAGGSLNGYSYRINGDLKAYRSQIERGENPMAHLLNQSEHRGLFDPIKGSMERGRLNLTSLAVELERRTGLDLDAIIGPLLEQWQYAGLLNRKADWVDLTIAGRFWQVTMTQNLLEWLNQNINEKRKSYSLLK